MKPDDEALISIFYCLGYAHGRRSDTRNVKGEPTPDRDQEKFLIDCLPLEVSALRFGGDPEPAIRKIKALVRTWKTENEIEGGATTKD